MTCSVHNFSRLRYYTRYMLYILFDIIITYNTIICSHVGIMLYLIHGDFLLTPVFLNLISSVATGSHSHSGRRRRRHRRHHHNNYDIRIIHVQRVSHTHTHTHDTYIHKHVVSTCTAHCFPIHNGVFAAIIAGSSSTEETRSTGEEYS